MRQPRTPLGVALSESLLFLTLSVAHFWNGPTRSGYLPRGMSIVPAFGAELPGLSHLVVSTNEVRKNVKEDVRDFVAYPALPSVGSHEIVSLSRQ